MIDKWFLALFVALLTFCGMLIPPQAVCEDSEKSQKSPAKTVVTDSKNKGLEGVRAGEERSDNGLKLKLMWCPPGKFTMGSPRDEKGRGIDEDQVSVNLTRGFWLGKYEVTQSQWTAIMKSEPWKGEDRVREGAPFPATYIRYTDAVDFVTTLKKVERAAKRLPKDWEYALPTEAQWEYACRAETTTRFWFGDNESPLGDYAWWGSEKMGNTQSESYAHQVGQKRPNPWGLHDIHGNVYEWCRDGYQNKLPGGIDPVLKTGGSNIVASTKKDVRTYRGGAWSSFDDSFLRAANRGLSPEFGRGDDLGFRVALQQLSGTD